VGSDGGGKVFEAEWLLDDGIISRHETKIWTWGDVGQHECCTQMIQDLVRVSSPPAV
jgi:hypothetical protein